ncbi:MAG: 23S rRNA (guanosine(2251)-2'-O)-methyltransferase RlmB [Spirochaetaceae bacterium]|nr:23S rRNA (guanosine(2251)-2'-O)-methyltransferase RlmB [Spirochaetaceae bacterium]
MREALRAGRRRAIRLFVRSGRSGEGVEEVVALAGARGVPIESVDERDLASRVGPDVVHQGVVLEVGPLPELSLAELIDALGDGDETGGCRLVALDGVEDPQNVGALARVAESAGARGLILTDRRAPPITAAVSRASAGAVEWLPIARVPNLGRALSDLKEAGFWVVAAAPDDEGSLFSMEDRILTGNLVVVLGAEGAGIRRSILEQADHRVGIPMRGHVASLNVSTAGAVILYDLLRRSDARAPAGSLPSES